MASISSLLSPPNNLLYNPTKPLTLPPKLHFQIPKKTHFQNLPSFTFSPLTLSPKRSQVLFAVAEDTQVDVSSEAARKLYIGNIPRTVDNAELTRIVEEHGAVEKAEVLVFELFWCFGLLGHWEFCSLEALWDRYRISSDR